MRGERCKKKKLVLHGLLTGLFFSSCKDAFKQLNQSVDPCEDFYEYVCGGWENENPLGDSETFVTGLTLARERSYNTLRAALGNANRNYFQVSKIVGCFSSLVVVFSADQGISRSFPE